MKEEKKISQSDIDQASARLRPIAGFSPRVYLPAAYAFAILIVLFLILALPGIRKNGSYLVFEGAPAISAVYVGDDYKGSTSQDIFLKAGSYELRVERFGFAPSTFTVKVGGRLLGSLFFPRRQRVVYSLKADQPKAVLSAAFAEYSEWSLSGKPSALYQIPEALSDAVSALASTNAMETALDGAIPPTAENTATGEGDPAVAFTRDVAAMTTSAEAARDGLKASVIASSGGVPGPLSLARAARVALAAIGRDKSGAVWLGDILPRSSAKGTTPSQASSALSQLAARAATPSPSDPSSAPRLVGSTAVGGNDFALFSAGTITLGGEAPSGSRAGYSQILAPFGLAKTEVTNRQWAAFLADNPRWRPENRAALAANDLVDEAYLAAWTADISTGTKASLPVTGVSWAAASAYCEWLSTRLGGSWKAALPTEAMWEAAARAGLGDASATTQKKATWSDSSASGPAPVGASGYDAAGLADLFGNVWEWCADAYRPYPALAAGTFSGPERAVRGGSWANGPESVSVYSRGGVAASHSSEFLGFRPALVAR